MFSFGSKQLVGLDIGTSSLKLAQVKMTRSGPMLTHFSMIATPPSAISGGEVLDVDGVSKAIKSIFQEANVKLKNVSSGMWGSAVIIKKISIPQMDEKLIGEQIRWEAEQYIPFDINEISLAHHVLQESSQGGDAMDILLIAAKQDLVLQYAEVIGSAGYDCKVVDVNGFALANCFEANLGLSTDAIALVNIGASVTGFVVVDNGEVVFCRDIPVGGSNYTSEIHKDMGVSMEEAEALKLSASAQQEVPDEVHSLISATNESVAEEIQNSFEFFHATSSGSQISRLYFTGGGSQTPGVMDQVSMATGVTGEIFDPFMGFMVDGKKISNTYIEQIKPFAGVAVGLALRKLGDL